MLIIDVNDLTTTHLCKIGDSSKGKKYQTLICSFDIESTNLTHNNNKYAFMYSWQFCIQATKDKLVILGRRWEEYNTLLQTLKTYYDVTPKHKLFIGVHNLKFEFSFICKRFEWDKVFCIDERTPLYANDVDGFSYHCTYLMSGMALKNLCTDTSKTKFDYSIIRNSKTPLTEDEKTYICNDVIIVCEYLTKQVELFGSLDKIPTTITGVVRQDIKKAVNSNPKTVELYKRSKFENVQQFELARLCFQGGFTHQNRFYYADIVNDVTSYDFTSSYPSVMLSEKFPFYTPRRINNPTLADIFKSDTFSIFPIKMYNIKNKFVWEQYISQHKCVDVVNGKTSNGRVISADSLLYFCTNVDLEILMKVYSFEFEIPYIYRWVCDYLPKEYFLKIDDYYKSKTSLKGIEKYKDTYQLKKGMLNSLYGMSVTNTIKDDFTFKNGEWTKTPVDVEKALIKEQCKKSRFSFYLQGVAITAYARRNIWQGILECGQDYLYCDTDSVKIINAENHKTFFDNYNVEITKKITQAYKHHNLEYEIPQTIDGIPKPLGVFDFDGYYKQFKSLGSKRYCYIDDNNKLHCTVAGLPKESGEKIFKTLDDFKKGIYVPPSKSGKLNHTYIDYPTQLTVVDSYGNVDEMVELSSSWLGDTDFTLSVSIEYELLSMDLKRIIKGDLYR